MTRAGVAPAGTRIAGYELVRRLAVGGMGEVFLARQRGMAGFQRLVALKRLIPDLAEQGEYVTLFIDEARLAANLSHPNIVQVHDFGANDGSYYMTMEYLAGQNLARIVARAAEQGRPLPRHLAVYTLAEIARALDYAHTALDVDGQPLGLVHRDVSPHNLFVCYRGDVKLMDFGIAKSTAAAHRTRTGTVRGKFAYMSPEQLQGHPLDPRSDLFAAGVVLWELTVHRRLFSGNDVELVRQVCDAPIPRPRDIDAGYPPDLERVVMAALERDVDRRVQSAAALRDALREILAAGGETDHRDELGRFVRSLFDDEAAVSAREAEAAISGSATDPVPGAASTTVGRQPAQAVRPPRWRRTIALLALIAAGAGAVAWLTTRPTSDGAAAGPPRAPSKVATAQPSGPAAPPTPRVDPLPPAREEPVSAASDAAVPAVRDDSRGRPRRRRSATAPAPAPVATPETPAAAAPPPAAGRGTLIVSSEPWGTVRIDGVRRKSTPLQLDLPAGPHRVHVEVSGGLGTVAGTAQVEPGKRSKCRVSGSRLRCEAPR